MGPAEEEMVTREFDFGANGRISNARTLESCVFPKQTFQMEQSAQYSSRSAKIQ